MLYDNWTKEDLIREIRLLRKEIQQKDEEIMDMLNEIDNLNFQIEHLYIEFSN